jgi:hypothetical protein
MIVVAMAPLLKTTFQLLQLNLLQYNPCEIQSKLVQLNVCGG